VAAAVRAPRRADRITEPARPALLELELQTELNPPAEAAHAVDLQTRQRRGVVDVETVEFVRLIAQDAQVVPVQEWALSSYHQGAGPSTISLPDIGIE